MRGFVFQLWLSHRYRSNCRDLQLSYSAPSGPNFRTFFISAQPSGKTTTAEPRNLIFVSYCQIVTQGTNFFPIKKVVVI